MSNKKVSDEYNTSDAQLNILKEITKICHSININLWLRGGWAIDFLIGEVTRAHADIDFVTWIHFREPLEKALVQAGFQKIPVSELQTDFLKNNVDLSFVFVRKSNEGKIVANGFPDWIWRKDALPIQTYELQGISINVLNPHQLLEEKQVYEEGTGRKLRPKDIQSMKIIQEIIDKEK